MWINLWIIVHLPLTSRVASNPRWQYAGHMTKRNFDMARQGVTSNVHVGVRSSHNQPVGHARHLNNGEKNMAKATKATPATPADESNAQLVALLIGLSDTNNLGKFEVLTITAEQGLSVRALRDSFKKSGSGIFKPDHADFVIHLSAIYAVRKDWKDFDSLLSTFRGYDKNPMPSGEVLGVEGAVRAMSDMSVTTADLIANKPKRARKVGKVASEKDSAPAGDVVTLDTIGDYLIAFGESLDKDSAVRLAKIMVSTATLIKANAMARV